jgi:hypothetical protein
MESLPAAQHPIAEQLMKGGMPAVRTALTEQNAKAKAEGKPEVPVTAVLAIAEDLAPAVRLAEWLDRAEAALADAEELSLQDLRSVVVSASDVVRDERASTIADQLKAVLDRRGPAESQQWIGDVEQSLAAGRVVRALRLAARPPQPNESLPEELTTRLAEAAGGAMTAEIEPDRWATVLDAVAYSPVRRSVNPAGVPAEPGDELLALVRKHAGRSPAIAALFGIEAPAPKERRPRRGGSGRPKASGAPATGPAAGPPGRPVIGPDGRRIPPPPRSAGSEGEGPVPAAEAAAPPTGAATPTPDPGAPVPSPAADGPAEAAPTPDPAAPAPSSGAAPAPPASDASAPAAASAGPGASAAASAVAGESAAASADPSESAAVSADAGESAAASADPGASAAASASADAGPLHAAGDDPRPHGDKVLAPERAMSTQGPPESDAAGGVIHPGHDDPRPHGDKVLAPEGGPVAAVTEPAAAPAPAPEESSPPADEGRDNDPLTPSSTGAE